jgi:outer membrane protein TolC
MKSWQVYHDRLKKLFAPATILLSLLIPNWTTPLLGQPLELDLETVHQIAVANNPQLKVAQKDRDRARSQVKASFGGLLPTVATYSSYQRAWELPTIFFDNPDPTGPPKISFKVGQTHTLVSGIKFEQPLFLGGAAWNGYQLAKLGYNLSETQYEMTRETVLLDATTAYLGLLFARSLIDMSQQAVETAEENLQQVQEMEKVGKASRFDILRAEVQLASVKPQLISAQNNVRLAESRLRMVLNLPANQKLVVTETLQYVPDPLMAEKVEELVQKALEKRPEMQALLTQKAMAQKQVAISRSTLAPKVLFSTTYQYQGEKESTDFTQDDFFKSFNSSISMNLPLFSGWQNQTQIQQAKINLRILDDQEAMLRQTIRGEVESAFFTIQETEEKVLSQIKLVEQAQEALRLARLRYREGSSTQLDVMNAEVALNQARMSHYQSLFEYNLARTQLQKALNQL